MLEVQMLIPLNSHRDPMTSVERWAGRNYWKGKEVVTMAGFHQGETMKRGGQMKPWFGSKAMIISFKCFFSKAGRYSHSNHFVYFWCFNCNSNATVSRWMTSSLVLLTHSCQVVTTQNYSGPGSVFDLSSALWSWVTAFTWQVISQNF